MNRNFTLRVGRLFGVALACIGGLGCAGSATSTTAENTSAATSSDALTTAQDTSDTPELADVLTQISAGPRDEGLEAWRCDPNPTVTTTSICGRDVPTAIHFTWTSCSEQRGPGADPHPCGAGGAGTINPGDGGSAPAPADAPTSSGTVDLGASLVADSTDACDGGTFTVSETSVFDVTRSGALGTQHVSGSTQSSSDRALEAHAFHKSTTLDVNEVSTSPDGGSASSALSGTLSVTFDDSSGAPRRTVNGALNLSLPSGDTATATLSNVVRDPPRVCRSPISGSIKYAESDGMSHELDFGPRCGDATLDGASVSLDVGAPGGGNGRGQARGN